jgi:calcineurin-like phosphoesterase family protein
MNQALIDNWNSVVSNKDTVYHLGDFILDTRPQKVDAILEQLNGHIVFIQGNHDKWLSRLNRLAYKHKILDVYPLLERTITYNKDAIKIVMCHYPMFTWNKSHFGSIQLHGHCHGSIDQINDDIRRLDVGVDAKYSNYTPIPEYEIIQLLTQPHRKYAFNHGD